MLSESSYGNFSSLPSAYVTDYGDRLVFSQKYTNDVSATVTGLPFMDAARSDEEIASTFYRFISDKKLDILNKL